MTFDEIKVGDIVRRAGETNGYQWLVVKVYLTPQDYNRIKVADLLILNAGKRTGDDNFFQKGECSRGNVVTGSVAFTKVNDYTLTPENLQHIQDYVNVRTEDIKDQLLQLYALQELVGPVLASAPEEERPLTIGEL